MRNPTGNRTLYRWWREALLSKAKGCRLPDVVETEPQPGFYQTRLKRGGVLNPVAIWMNQPTDDGGQLIDDETIVAKLGDAFVDVGKVWPWCATRPITKKEYDHFRQHGRWPGEGEVDKITVKVDKIDVTKQDPIF